LKKLQFIHQAEDYILVWTILTLACIGFVQVISRYVFNISFTWFEELGRYLGVFIAFSGAAIGVRTGSHFLMDLIVSRLKAPYQNIIKTLTALLSSAFFIMVAWYSCKLIIKMYGYGTTSPTMQIQMFIPYLPIPFFSMVMGFRFIVKALGSFQSIFSPVDGNKESDGNKGQSQKGETT
jgi:C4-dicarboxylate transporter DctQ subunit